MTAPVDAITMVDVRIEVDIIRECRRTRRKTVYGIWTLLFSYVMIQTDIDTDFQPLHDGNLQNFGAHQESAKPRSLAPVFADLQGRLPLKLL